MQRPDMNFYPTRAPAALARQQKGLSLIFALLALVALSLASVALVRSIGTSTLVLGNLGFKQTATSVADYATQQAIEALGLLVSKDTDVAASAYYASVDNTLLDATGQQLNAATTPTRKAISWPGTTCTTATPCVYAPTALTSVAGLTTASPNTQYQYAIFRMCSAAGVADPANCAMPTNDATGSSSKRGKLDYADALRFGSQPSPYYRIIVRVQGDRNTVSYVETLVHF